MRPNAARQATAHPATARTATASRATASRATARKAAFLAPFLAAIAALALLALALTLALMLPHAALAQVQEPPSLPAPGSPLAQDQAGRLRVQRLLQDALAHFRAVGRDRAMADFTRAEGRFGDRQNYIACSSMDLQILAFGANPATVGRQASGLRDARGFAFALEMRRLMLERDEGWVSYVWLNPESGRFEEKVSYVLRFSPELFCLAGYYGGGE